MTPATWLLSLYLTATYTQAGTQPAGFVLLSTARPSTINHSLLPNWQRYISSIQPYRWQWLVFFPAWLLKEHNTKKDQYSSPMLFKRAWGSSGKNVKMIWIDDYLYYRIPYKKRKQLMLSSLQFWYMLTPRQTDNSKETADDFSLYLRKLHPFAIFICRSSAMKHWTLQCQRVYSYLIMSCFSKSSWLNRHVFNLTTNQLNKVGSLQ